MYRPEVYLKSILHTKDKMKSIRVQIVSQLISAMSMLSCGFYSRAFILFLTGTSLATLKFFQYLGTDSHIGRSLELTSKLYCGWWIPVMAGVFACIIGLLYPCVDSKVGEPHYFRRDWTSVVRCVAVFVGINHFSSKSQFLADRSQQFAILLGLAIGLWWMFDRSPYGLGIGLIASVLGTACTFIMAHLVYRQANFLYSQSWLPCLYFAGACTFGSFGRQLALMDQGIPHIWKTDENSVA